MPSIRDRKAAKSSGGKSYQSLTVIEPINTKPAAAFDFDWDGLFIICIRLVFLSISLYVVYRIFVFTSAEYYQAHNKNHVRRIRVEPTEDFAVRMSQEAVPTVILGAVASTWKNMWTPTFLAKHVRVLTDVYRHTHASFGPYYNSQRPLHGLSNVVDPNPFEKNVRMSARDFFRHCLHPEETPGVYLSYSGELDRFPPQLVDMVNPLDELLRLRPDHSSVNVWMGQANATTPCHYDGYHNFYSQIYGHKTFLLLAPDQAKVLMPNPFLHPNHAQCQLNLTSADPAALHLDFQRVTLYPGDMLYIPPLWFHEVISNDVSIAVNVWTDSSQSDTMKRVWDLAIPISDEARSDVYQASIEVANLALGLASPMPVAFIKSLYNSRYRRLAGLGALPPGLWPRGAPCEGNNYPRISQKTAARHASYVASALAGLAELPSSTRPIWTGNLLELIVASAVGAANAPSLLKQLPRCMESLASVSQTKESLLA